MTILLTHSNHLFYDEKQREKMEPYPPLQTLLAAAVLRKAGHTVEVCDVAFEVPEITIRACLDRLAPCFVLVCEDDFNFLTKMCLSRNRDLAFWTAHVTRGYGCKTAVHGSDSTDHVDEYLRAGFDYVLIGEVEQTLLELASGTDPYQIAGLAFQDQQHGRTVRTSPRKPRKNLDELPSPAWDLINVHAYRKAWISRHGVFSLNLVTSRGCPYRCNWCAKPIYGNDYHVRSPQVVAEEMLHLKRRYAPDHIWFADDIFALSARWTREFADAVAQLDARIPFKMQSRCDLMTRETVVDLKRAGCREVWMGAESGSQRILDAMEKGTRLDQIHQASENLKRNKIRVGWFLQFGYPGESWEDIEATVRMVRQAKPDDIGVSVSYPLPGTKFHQIVSSQISQKANWSESGDLAMIFKGTFSTELYRLLAHALHLEVRTPENTAAVAGAWADLHSLRSKESTAQEAVA
jgi:anaerobic magnesium-protoporphyrin IX monomethyl ester cyclase